MKIEYFTVKDFLSEYKNNGQALEQEYRLFKSGKLVKADNLPADKGCDFECYSIKSARATVCKGTDLLGHLAMDKAKEFIYLTKSKIAYIMSRDEYIDFIKEFGTKTVESAKNGGKEKIRLGHETKALLEWLEQRSKASA